MSASSPDLAGTLPDGGPIEVLHDLESRRLTGLLHFEQGDMKGSILLYGGEIAVEQEARDDGIDPVDLFLEMTTGTWSMHAELPPLPVSRGTGNERSGSLAVHVPVDLMSYCEHAGLTGVLELTHEGRRAEATYEAGELLAIELDGRDATDLHEVFGWVQGRFRVAIDNEAPGRLATDAEELEELDIVVEEPTLERWAPAPPSKREDTRQFLKVVQMALADVIQESEKARSPTRTSPPLPPPPKKRPRPKSIPAPPPRRRDDQTVRLIYLTGDAPEASAGDVSTRHVHVGTGQVKEKALTEAQPERRASSERSSMGRKRRNKRGKPKPTSGSKATAKPAAKTKPAANAKPAAKAKPGPRAEPATKAKLGASKQKAAEKSEDKPDTQVRLRILGFPISLPLQSFAGATAWAFGVVILGLVILAVLAKLPAVE